jgi:phage protein D/phage baseplate assembly protein gpV
VSTADLVQTDAPVVQIDGSDLPVAVAARIEEVVVDDSLHEPDTFLIRFTDPERTVLDDSGVKVGSSVRISVGGLKDDAPAPLISGEVTSVEAEYGEVGSSLIIRGYDKSHRLARGRHTETYRNVKYSDIAGRIADRASLDRGRIDDSGAVFELVSQANQSDWDFLGQLAREIDFEVAVVDDALDFRRPPDASTAPPEGDFDSSDPLQLVLGDELLEFRPRISGAGQVSRVEVRGWSVADKAAIVGTAPAGTSSASLPDDPATLASRFGDATFVSVDAGPADQRTADRLAGRYAELVGSTFAEATGTARGTPKLRAGKAISVAVVGEPFEGRFTLTRTRHVYDLVHGYRAHIEVSGRQDRSLLALASGGPGGAGISPGSGRSRVVGVVTGVVDDIDDPQKLGRVRVRLPWLSDDYVGDWARVALLGAGPNRGAVWLPEHDDEVLVAFEQGDITRPVVIGGLWNGKDQPPTYEVDQGRQKFRSLVSRRGHTLTLRDGDDSSTIELTTSDGKLSLVLDETNGEIKLTADGTTKVTISAGGDLAIKAQGQLTLEGQQGAELTSSATVKVKGQAVQLNPPG